MSQPQQRDLLPALMQIAEVNLPQLKHEIDTNGSAIFKLQAAVAELHTIVSYVVHHAIDERRRLMAAIVGAATPAPALATPQPAQPPAQPPRFVPATVQRPTLPPLGAAAPIAPPPALPGAVDRGPVMDVTITPQGTRAVLPGAAGAIVVPPGASIDASMLEAAQAPGGVVLPPGGEMSPEVAAALAAASGGARNVTADPIPQG